MAPRSYLPRSNLAIALLAFPLISTAAVAASPHSNKAVITMTAVMPPSATVRIPQANRQTQATITNTAQSIQVSVSHLGCKEPTELPMIPEATADPKICGARLRSSLSWGIATFTLEAF